MLITQAQAHNTATEQVIPTSLLGPRHPTHWSGCWTQDGENNGGVVEVVRRAVDSNGAARTRGSTGKVPQQRTDGLRDTEPK